MTEDAKLSPDQNDLERLDVRKAVRQQLDSLRLAGLTHLPKGRGDYAFDWTGPADSAVKEAKPGLANDQPVVSADASVSSEPAQALSSTTAPNRSPAPSPPSSSESDSYGPLVGLSDRKSELHVLQEQVAGCTKCPELSSQRTQTVFGVGDPASRLVFVGEAPGAQEDRQGEPFVGEAGQLLDKILEACNFSRSDVYILNTVKCRPPANRNPGQEELANCWGYAERQLEIIQPEFICCLGSVAARTLLKTTQSLGRLRKQFHSYRGSRVLVTYHPAYLLRTPSAKRHVWEDMQMLMKELGVDLSK